MTPASELEADTATGGALPTRREMFCREYVVDFNGGRAARAAGYSAKRCRQTASELLDREDVQQRVCALLGQRIARTDFSRDAVIRQVGAVMNASIRDLVKINKDGDVELRKEADIPDEAWLAVSAISRDKDGRLTVKLHNKSAAIDYLGRVHKLWEGAGVGAVNLTVRLVRELGPSAPASARRVG
jgi:phage terminase small subunit